MRRKALARLSFPGLVLPYTPSAPPLSKRHDIYNYTGNHPTLLASQPILPAFTSQGGAVYTYTGAVIANGTIFSDNAASSVSCDVRETVQARLSSLILVLC